MIKYAYYASSDPRGPAAVPLFTKGTDSYFEKVAAPALMGDVVRYISGLKPRADAQYMLVNAMGASEWWGCFPAGTLIRTNDGEQAIEQVPVGTGVLTHCNKYRKTVATKKKHYKGPLADLYVQGLPSLTPALTATPNHELWVVLRDDLLKARREQVYRGDSGLPIAVRRQGMLQSLPFSWVPIGDLRRGDWIAQPFPLEEDLSALGDAQWNTHHIAFLMGLYAAEGCLAYRYDGKGLEDGLAKTVFVLSSNEKETLRRAQEAAAANGHALTVTPDPSTHSMRLELSWAEFARLCARHIGTSAISKRLSSDLLKMPKKWQRSFFQAYAGGDGSIKRSGMGEGSITCTSASAGLLVDLRLLLGRLGIISSLSGRHNTKSTWYNGNPIFSLLVGSSQLSGDAPQAKSYLHPAGFILSPVDHVELQDWEGEVYDLQVCGDCSYTASGISVHNSNINGDAFSEEGLVHAPDRWTGDPEKDKIAAKDWPYGFPTFYNARPYLHHRNKPYPPFNHPHFGEVELALWHPRMKRVELVTRIDKDLCQKSGGTGLWDKLRAGGYPDLSMGTHVPFDTSSLTLDRKLYQEALASFDPDKHKYPGEAVLSFHKKLKAKNGVGIKGLSITVKDYDQFTKDNMGKILPDGRKGYVDNDFPRFFDISYVFIGADRTAKAMMKIADGEDFTPMAKAFYGVPSGPAGTPPEPPGGEHDLSTKPGGDEDQYKAASAEDALKLAFLGKRATLKAGEINKHTIPSQFTGKAIPLLTKNEAALPHDVLDALATRSPEEALSTTTGMGMVLRPSEFQRVLLKQLGKHSLADQLEDSGKIFPKTDEKAPLHLDAGLFNTVLAKLLLPFLAGRSAFGPHIEGRCVMLVSNGGPEVKTASSLSTPLLRKISAAYNGYREQMLNLIPEAQNVLSHFGAGGDSVVKLAQCGVEELFTSMSAFYLRDAFLDEVGEPTIKQAQAGVERDHPQGTREISKPLMGESS